MINSERIKQEMDFWVKEIKKEISKLKDNSNITEELVGDIQHNYELIIELKDEIEYLKQEINAIKVIQIIALKKQICDILPNLKLRFKDGASSDLLIQTLSHLVPASTTELATEDFCCRGSISTGVEIPVSPTVSFR